MVTYKTGHFWDPELKNDGLCFAPVRQLSGHSSGQAQDSTCSPTTPDKRSCFPYINHQHFAPTNIESYVEPALDTGLLTSVQTDSGFLRNPDSLSQLDPLLYPDIFNTSDISESRSLVLAQQGTLAEPTVSGPPYRHPTGYPYQLLSIGSRFRELEERLIRLEQYGTSANIEARLQRSIDTQHVLLSKLCSGIDRLAESSVTAATEAAEAAEATVSATATLASAANSAVEAAARIQPPTPPATPISAHETLARASIEVVFRTLTHSGVCAMRGLTKVATEADVVVALLCHKVLLSDYKPGQNTTEQPQYLTLRTAKRGGLFLASAELSWFLTDRALKNMPDALLFLFGPILKPVRYCTSYARWLGWLAFSYLAVRSVQQGCSELARLASLPTPPSTPRPASKNTDKTDKAEKTEKAEKVKKLPKAVSLEPECEEDEITEAIKEALAPVPDKCSHCGARACHGCCGGAGSGKLLKVTRKKKAEVELRKQASVEFKKALSLKFADQERADCKDKSREEEAHILAAKAGARALRTFYKGVGTASGWIQENWRQVLV